MHLHNVIHMFTYIAQIYKKQILTWHVPKLVSFRFVITTCCSVSSICHMAHNIGEKNTTMCLAFWSCFGQPVYCFNSAVLENTTHLKQIQHTCSLKCTARCTIWKRKYIFHFDLFLQTTTLTLYSSKFTQVHNVLSCILCMLHTHIPKGIVET